MTTAIQETWTSRNGEYFETMSAKERNQRPGEDELHE